MSTPAQLHAQGIQAMGSGEYDKAIELFEIVTQHQPQQPVPWANLCKATVAAEFDPQDPSRPLFVAKLLALHGRCDQARQALAAAAADGGGDIATARSLVEKKCSAE